MTIEGMITKYVDDMKAHGVPNIKEAWPRVLQYIC